MLIFGKDLFLGFLIRMEWRNMHFEVILSIGNEEEPEEEKERNPWIIKMSRKKCSTYEKVKCRRCSYCHPFLEIYDISDLEEILIGVISQENCRNGCGDLVFGVYISQSYFNENQEMDTTMNEKNDPISPLQVEPKYIIKGDCCQSELCCSCIAKGCKDITFNIYDHDEENEIVGQIQKVDCV